MGGQVHRALVWEVGLRSEGEAGGRDSPDLIPCNSPGGLDNPGHGSVLANGFLLSLRQHGGVEIQGNLAFLRHVAVPMKALTARKRIWLSADLGLEGDEELEVETENPVIAPLKIVGVGHAVAVDVTA